MDEANYTVLGAFLDWWSKNPVPLTLEQMSEKLPDAEIFAGLRLGCIGHDRDHYIYRHSTMIDNQFGVDSFRFKRILGELAATMRKNKFKRSQFERSCYVAHIPEDELPEVREWIRAKLTPVLEEINDYLVDRDADEGVNCGVNMFQFDGGE